MNRKQILSIGLIIVFTNSVMAQGIGEKILQWHAKMLKRCVSMLRKKKPKYVPVGPLTALLFSTNQGRKHRKPCYQIQFDHKWDRLSRGMR